MYDLVLILGGITVFFFNDTATTEIYTLSLHDALPIYCRQGNGEVNLTALECAYREIVMQLIVRKDLKLDWPRVETKTHWIMLGFDEDLNRAMVSAVRETEIGRAHV